MMVSKAFFNKVLDADWDLVMRTEGFNGTPREVTTLRAMIDYDNIRMCRKSGKTSLIT